MAETDAIIREGAVLLYRLFEVADEIDLEAAEARLSALAPPRRLRFARVAPRHIQLANPPVAVALPSVSVPVLGTPAAVGVEARVYDYGAISVRLSVPLDGWTLARLHEAGHTLGSDPAIDEAATRMLETLLFNLKDAVRGAHPWDCTEDYTIFFITGLSPELSADELLGRIDVVPLLLGEGPKSRLSAQEREDVLKHRLSYGQDDLTILDWNAALVYEPSGEVDLPDILEYATSQLLELRYYDDLLDRELDRIYEKVALGSRAWNPLLPNRQAGLARQITLLLVEVTEITERIENSLKVIDDLYLAKVYRAAVERFRIPRWQSSVQRKLALVQSVHQLVMDQIRSSRSLLLEAAIVVLIVVELVLALWKARH